MIDFIVGVIVATLSGMGVGGGGLLVLYLVFVKSFGQLEAQGLNLLFFIAACGSSLSFHIRKRKIDYRLCLYLVVGGTLGAVLGSITAQEMDPMIVRKVFGWLLVLSGIITLFGREKKNKKIDKKY